MKKYKFKDIEGNTVCELFYKLIDKKFITKAEYEKAVLKKSNMTLDDFYINGKFDVNKWERNLLINDLNDKELLELIKKCNDNSAYEIYVYNNTKKMYEVLS